MDSDFAKQASFHGDFVNYTISQSDANDILNNTLFAMIKRSSFQPVDCIYTENLDIGDTRSFHREQFSFPPSKEQSLSWKACNKMTIKYNKIRYMAKSA
jgi:hypothetical protein